MDYSLLLPGIISGGIVIIGLIIWGIWECNKKEDETTESITPYILDIYSNSVNNDYYERRRERELRDQQDAAVINCNNINIIL